MNDARQAHGSDAHAFVGPAPVDARKAQARIKGRGAASHVTGRYEKTVRHGEDDGWGSVYDHALVEGEADALPQLATQVTEERARSIISRNTSPDIGFSQSVNPYRGCEHGCVYCFARPSHAYLDRAPGLAFGSRLVAKANAPGPPGSATAEGRRGPTPA